MRSLELDVVATRGAEIESRHRVHAAVVGRDDSLVAARARHQHRQLLALVRQAIPGDAVSRSRRLRRAAVGRRPTRARVRVARRRAGARRDRAGDARRHRARRGRSRLRPARPALAARPEAASRVGRAPDALAQQLLRKARRDARARAHRGVADVRLRAARSSGAAVLPAGVGEWAGLEESDIGQAVDGCGVVAFALPLENMARAWSRLGSRSRDAATRSRRASCTRCATRPFLVGGTDRFDSVLIEETDGRVVAKIGAEGVHCVGGPRAGHRYRGEGRRRRAARAVPGRASRAPALRRPAGTASAAARGILPPAGSQHARRNRRRDSARRLTRRNEFGSPRRRLMTPPADMHDMLDAPRRRDASRWCGWRRSSPPGDERFVRAVMLGRAAGRRSRTCGSKS